MGQARRSAGSALLFWICRSSGVGRRPGSVSRTCVTVACVAALPQNSLSFLGFLSAFLVAVLIGMASHVPGGVGVFDGLMVLLLNPFLTSQQLLPALIVFRAVYYLVPFIAALILLLADELRQHRSRVARAGDTLGPVTEQPRNSCRRRAVLPQVTPGESIRHPRSTR